MKDRLAKYIARQCSVCGLTYPTTYEGKNFRCPDHLAEYIRTQAAAKVSAKAVPIVKVVQTIVKQTPATHTLTCLSNIGAMLKDKAAGY